MFQPCPNGILRTYILYPVITGKFDNGVLLLVFVIVHEICVLSNFGIREGVADRVYTYIAM